MGVSSSLPSRFFSKCCLLIFVGHLVNPVLFCIWSRQHSSGVPGWAVSRPSSGGAWLKEWEEVLLGGCNSGFLWLFQVYCACCGLQVWNTCVSEPLQWGGLGPTTNHMMLWRNSSFELSAQHFTLEQRKGGWCRVLGVLKAKHSRLLVFSWVLRPFQRTCVLELTDMCLWF